MNTKISLLLAALVCVLPAFADDAAHDGHDHAAESAQPAVGKDGGKAKPADAQAIAAAASGAKCKPHKAAKADCFICNPALREKGRMWCKEHSRYEDRCFKCHPEIKDAKRLYCEEHGLYEDECFLCHPELKPQKKAGKPAPSKGKPDPAAKPESAKE